MLLCGDILGVRPPSNFDAEYQNLQSCSTRSVLCSTLRLFCAARRILAELPRSLSEVTMQQGAMAQPASNEGTVNEYSFDNSS